MRTMVSRQCSLSSALPEPLVVQPDAAGEPDAAVDDEDLPVRTVVQLLERVPLGLAELADLDAGGLRALLPLLRNLVGAHGVDDQLDDDAALRGRDERVGELPADGALVVDVGLEADAPLGARSRRRASGGRSDRRSSARRSCCRRSGARPAARRRTGETADPPRRARSRSSGSADPGRWPAARRRWPSTTMVQKANL